MIENSQKWYILDLPWWLIYFLCSVYVLLAQRDYFGNPECLWFITYLNIAQICFMIKISQKWYILDLPWWLVYFLCSVYVLLAQRDYFGNPECLWFITYLNIAQICFMIENSQKWYILDLSWQLVYFLCSMYCHLPKEHPHMFFLHQSPSPKAAFHQNISIVIILIFLFQILCYSYSELPGNVEIYFRFFQKNSPSIRGAEDDGCTSHVPDDLFQVTNNYQQSVAT